jgi:uncharacterized protein (DUF4415 family)
MENEQNIVRYTLAELKEMNARGESHQTDWARLNAMTEEGLEASIDWDDEGEFDLSQAFAGLPPMGRAAETVRLTGAIVSWFQARGGDHLARIRCVLRDYVNDQQAQLATKPRRQRTAR